MSRRRLIRVKDPEDMSASDPEPVKEPEVTIEVEKVSKILLTLKKKLKKVKKEDESYDMASDNFSLDSDDVEKRRSKPKADKWEKAIDSD